jgi:hypothetical protein
MRARNLLLLALVTSLSMTACSKDGDGGPPFCGDEKTARSPIINGDPMWDTSLITITDAQAKAVGFLELGGVGGCSGTLIAPATVLTAAHCVYSRPSYVRFYVGRDYYAPEGVYNATDYVAHPYYGGRYVDYDVAIVKLATDPVDDGVEPIPVHLEPPQRLAGDQVVAVGYGITRPGVGGNSLRWWTVLSVIRETPTIYTTSGGGVTGPCQGDSGGPMLWMDATGPTMVMGPVSSVESYDCVGEAYYPRADAEENAWFIRSYLPEDPCGDETYEGRCDGTSAIWCEGTTVMNDECDPWEACQMDGDGLYRCVVVDTCMGETLEGRCTDEGHAIWCEDGTILTHPCPDFGWWCSLGEDGLYRCQPPGPCEAAGLDWNGECTADGHARWCEDGQIRDRDCWLCDQDCGWAGDLLGFYCIDR